MILFAAIYFVVETVVMLVAVFQFFFYLFTSELNERALKLGQSLSTYTYQIFRFLTFNSESHPYPFDTWPKDVPRTSDKQMP